MSIKEDGTIEIGTTVKFAGYSELPDDQQPVFQEGDLVIIRGYSADTENYQIEGVENSNMLDGAFAEELEMIEAGAEEEAEEEAAPAKKPRTRAAKKPKTEAAETTEEAPAKATKKPAKAKAKAKPAPTKAKEETTATTGGVAVHTMVKDLVATDEAAIAAADELASTLTEASEQLEVTKFSLGGVLAVIRENKSFEGLGFESIEAYCHERLNLGERSCQTYMQVYVNLTNAGITAKEIETIGVSKLRTIAGIVDKGNKKALLTAAKKKTRDDLVAHVKEIRAGKTGAEAAPSEYAKIPAMSVHTDKAAMIESALAEAMKTYETPHQGEALYYMAADFMQQQEAEVPLEDALAAFNARYGTEFELEEEEA